MSNAPVNGPQDNGITEQIQQNHKMTPRRVVAFALVLFGEDDVGDVHED